MSRYEIDYNSVGERIRNLRTSKNITQDQLSELLEINPSHLSNIERGRTKMSTDTLVNISRSLNVSIDYLIFGDITLEFDQYTNIALLEIKELLKDKNKNDFNTFMAFIKNCIEFLQKIDK